MVTARFARCLGLNTVSAPESLVYDDQTKAWEAAALVNLDVVDGRLVNRAGYSLALAGSWRDGWNSPDGRAFAVVDDVIVQVADDLSTTALVTLQSPGRVVWAALDELVFWSNGVEAGLIQDGAAVSWGGKTYPVVSQAGRYVDPAAGQALGSGFGRVWIWRENELCYTAGSGAFHFEEAGVNGMTFPGRGTFVRAVDDGLYVGTDAGVWFLSGTDPGQMAVIPVTSDPVMAVGTDIGVRSDDVSSKHSPSGACLFVTRSGIAAGLSGGTVLQLTNQRVHLDAPAQVAASVWLSSLRRYVCILHP